MKGFKFLTKNDTLNLNGQMSLEAVQHFNDYISDRLWGEVTTTVATYKIIDYIFGEGNIVAGTVHAYPLDASNIRVTYNIRGGEITSFTVDIDYWNTMGQLLNAIRRED